MRSPRAVGVGRFWPGLIAVGLLVAILIPAAWWASRPSASAGAPVVATSPAAGPTLGGSGSTTTQDPTTSPDPGSSPAAGVPQRLVIASLGIDASIDPMGVAADGSMALPPDVHQVGWYRFSPEPGAAQGSVVLAGHVDNARQGVGALFTLRSVAVGARILVQTSTGRTVAYRVTGRQLITKHSLPTDQLFDLAGSPRLIVITCGGPFIRALSSYRDNLVVAAVPVA